MSFRLLPRGLSNSVRARRCTMARVTTGSKGSRPSRVWPCSAHSAAMASASFTLRSALLMMMASGMRKCRHRSATRLKSWRPDGVGSTTPTARLAPDRELMTGQPTPGEPSHRMVSSPRALARSLAWALSRLTRRPEFSCPGKSWAWTIRPKRLSLTYQSPQ